MRLAKFFTESAVNISNTRRFSQCWEVAFSVHILSPFFVHFIPNLVSERVHDFFCPAMSTCIPRAPCTNSAPIHTLAPAPRPRTFCCISSFSRRAFLFPVFAELLQGYPESGSGTVINFGVYQLILFGHDGRQLIRQFSAMWHQGFTKVATLSDHLKFESGSPYLIKLFIFSCPEGNKLTGV